MTTTKRTIGAPVEAIWSVLADAHRSSQCVVGAKEVRDVEAGWPDAGTHFAHRVGAGPFTLADNTRSLESDPPHRLVTEARGRPLGRARIEMVMQGSGTSTEVTMTEHVVSPALLRFMDPVFGPVVRLRNTESLRRLASLVAPGRS